MPFTMLTTAITEVTPITTPRSVSTLRNLCAHKLAVAMRTASPKAIVVLVAIEADCSRLLYVPGAKLFSARPGFRSGGLQPSIFKPRNYQGTNPRANQCAPNPPTSLRIHFRPQMLGQLLNLLTILTQILRHHALSHLIHSRRK